MDFCNRQVYAWGAEPRNPKLGKLGEILATTLQIRFEATVLDELNVKATANAYVLVDPTASFNTILTQLNTWLADLDACTDGEIIGVEMEVVPALPGGLKSMPVAGSRVEQTGILNFNATGSTHLWAFSIPALSNSSTVLSGGKIVLTSGSPANILLSLLAGGGTAALAWTNNAQQIISAFANALLSFRNYARQLSRVTYERP